MTTILLIHRFHIRRIRLRIDFFSFSSTLMLRRPQTNISLVSRAFTQGKLPCTNSLCIKHLLRADLPTPVSPIMVSRKKKKPPGPSSTGVIRKRAAKASTTLVPSKQLVSTNGIACFPAHDFASSDKTCLSSTRSALVPTNIIGNEAASSFLCNTYLRSSGNRKNDSLDVVAKTSIMQLHSRAHQTC